MSNLQILMQISVILKTLGHLKSKQKQITVQNAACWKESEEN